jgi:MoaA/NifB/PqqE/SkfB family radical SAM enzyme
MIRKVYVDLARQRLARGQAGWVARRGAQYLLTHLSRVARRPLCGPILGTFVTNYTCNYRCTMCDISRRDRELKGRLREFSTDELKEILRDFARLGTAGIGFTGGEPLLREDLFELLRHCKELGMITHLNTNGSLLDEERAGQLLEAGVDSLNISLDGSRPETHDAIRGVPGAFERVKSAVATVGRLSRERGSPLRMKVVAVLSERNIDEVPGLIEVSRQWGTNCVEFIPRQPFDAERNRPQPDAAFQEKVRGMVKHLLAAKREGIRIEDSPRMLRLFPRSFRGEPSPLSCYAGYNSLAVDCYGEIYPCLPWLNWGKSVGNVRESPLREFWASPAYNLRRPEIAHCRECYLNCQTELNLLFNLKRVPGP